MFVVTSTHITILIAAIISARLELIRINIKNLLFTVSYDMVIKSKITSCELISIQA